MNLQELSGFDLGTHEHDISADDAILYALAVGAQIVELDLIYERDLRVLPTMACGIGLWAVERAGGLGAYDRLKSLHVGQSLVCKQPITPGTVSMSGQVGGVYDKGKMTIVEIDVAATQFDAKYTIFLPGVGDWGGPPPPASPRAEEFEAEWELAMPVSTTAAALYRLTGDKHPVHIDSVAAESMGLRAPILHGLATLGMAAHAAARSTGVHPADLKQIDARLSAPVYPGSELIVSGSGTQIRAISEDTVALTGSALF